MLIQFSVKNYRSIREKQTFSMVKGSFKEHEVTNTFEPNAPASTRLLRSAAIFGPNASGKTNVYDAAFKMKSIVVGSFRPGDLLPVEPFRLDSTYRKLPTEFEIVFISNNVRYDYGFAVSADKVHEEWLVAYPNGRPQKWFNRVWDDSKKKYNWDMGGFLLGQKQTWIESTRPNVLFLSTAANLNSQQLLPVYHWFNFDFRFGSIEGWDPNYTARQIEYKERKDFIVDFIAAADVDIHDLRVESHKISEKGFPQDMPEELKRFILSQNPEPSIFSIYTLHLDEKNEVIEFDLFDNESAGTKKLFSFAGPILDVLQNGYVLFVDELDNSFHPSIVKFLISLFHNKSINTRNAQLIFTTHDVSIMSQDIFRRDQIWFCEKQDDKSTLLYPLSDFSPRKGRDNLEAGYLSGRYGAVPFIDNLRVIKE